MLEQEILPVEAATVTAPASENLPTEDGIPLESPWHRAEINLLIESLRYHWRERTDYYTGGNMFVYYSTHQVRHRDYRGPDFYVVKNVDGSYEREAWVVWEEGGHYPDLIIELLSPSTAESDKTVKKDLYEQTFHTPEYYCYDPQTQALLGWRLQTNHYEAIQPDAAGRLWSDVLQLWVGPWEGEFQGRSAVWLRFFDKQDHLIPLRAEAEAARADQEAAARQAAEAEVARLQEEIARLRGEQS